MKHDAWSNLNEKGRDRLYKGLGHVDIQKMWSDEARAAALAARQHGYTENGQPTDAPGQGLPGVRDDYTHSRNYVHPDGHSLHIGSNGEWGHMESKGGQDAKMTHGKGAIGLNNRLESLHHTVRNNNLRAAHDAKLVAAKPNRKLSVGERHQHNIARDTLKYTPAMVGVMGGPSQDEARSILSHNTGLPPHPVSKQSYPLGPGPSIPAGIPTQSARQGMKDTMPKGKKKTTAKQAPPGPRVIEVDEDQDSLARTMESKDPAASWPIGHVTDGKEEGKDLMSPNFDPEDFGETPLNPQQRRKSAGPRVV